MHSSQILPFCFPSSQDPPATDPSSPHPPLLSTPSSPCPHPSAPDTPRRLTHPTRALTLPSSPRDPVATCPPLLPPKHPHIRRFSVSSSSSSSSEHSPFLPVAGIGRKVAESLQLFKESEERPGYTPRSGTTLAKRRLTTSHPNDGVAEARYEFVKRADWPDPETAALRRERSSTGLENVTTRESIDSQSKRDPDFLPSLPLTRDPPFSDPSHWRKDVSRKDPVIRGRCRWRTSDISTPEPQLTSPEPSPITVPQSPCIRPCSRAYPPSPSPSRSPTDRIPPLTLYNPAIDVASVTTEPSLSEFSGTFLVNLNRSRSRSPTPTHISPHASIAASPPPVLLRSPSFSPWSTDDDESAWETSSMTSDISTTSGTSEHPLSLFQIPDASISPLDEGDEIRAYLTAKSEGDPGYYGSNHWNADSLNMVYGDSEESLPHIPLRPFRNQVGGHSAIYKFTKRAVCKPLVSRENQFYEVVERQTPPLLGFIPRYLGVMLVTYRRVLKGSPTPPNLEPSAPFPVSVSHFSGSVVQRAISEPDYAFTNAPLERASPGGLPQEGGMTMEEAELPEVALDRNRHIIPKWLLHRGHPHGHTCTHAESLRPGWCSRQHIHSTQLAGATASSPALIQNQDAAKSSQSGPKQHPLIRQPTIPLDDGDPYYTGGMVRTTTFADPRSAWRIITSEDPQTSRPDLRAFHSESTIGSQQSPPSWFGGTGSTTVNTKLKDQIFSTILRRFHRRCKSQWMNDSRTENERAVSTRQGRALPASLRLRSTSRKHYAGPVERSKEEETTRCTSTLRRARSDGDGEMGHDGQNGTFDIDYNKLDDFVHQERSNLALDSEDGIRTLFARQRSRSRSVGSPVYLSSVQPPHQPISSSRCTDSVPRQHHFILMEDLTGRLKRSCVLDLKMGTRQYGMDAISSKKKSQRKKCDRTTSRPLGIRVCGMQVWNHATQSYITQDKYMGRDIRAEEFPSLLGSFLYDGERLLIWHIPILLQKLYALARIISRLKGFRFYGCSLLLIYDGDRDAQEPFRVSALEHLSSRSKRGESLERSQTRSRSQVAARSSLRRTHSEDLLSGPACKRSGGKRKRGEINVRIVDFVHTTTGRDWAPYPPPPDRAVVQQVSSSKGYQAEVDADSGIIYARFPPHYPTEPDRGFLFGLKNLTETLETIWNDERMRRIKVSRDDLSIDPSQLPPLITDGKEIFDEIFGPLEPGEDPGMLST